VREHSYYNKFIKILLHTVFRKACIFNYTKKMIITFQKENENYILAAGSISPNRFSQHPENSQMEEFYLIRIYAEIRLLTLNRLMLYSFA
jgi:hypothetical protein